MLISAFTSTVPAAATAAATTDGSHSTRYDWPDLHYVLYLHQVLQIIVDIDTVTFVCIVATANTACLEDNMDDEEQELEEVSEMLSSAEFDFDYTD